VSRTGVCATDNLFFAGPSPLARVDALRFSAIIPGTIQHDFRRILPGRVIGEIVPGGSIA